MHVPIFLHVVLMIKIDFILVLDVGKVGAGHVERNIVHFISILTQVKNVKMLKIITMLYVAEKKLDLRKKIIVKAVTAVIVERDGNN